MKKILSVFAVLLLAAVADAGNVTRDEAIRQAASFFGNIPVSDLEIVWTGTNPGSAPRIYAINNRKGGFVVISGSDNINPVLGYSMDGSFGSKNIPSNIRAWFSGIENDLAEIEKRNLRINEAERGLWNRPVPGTKAGGSVLLTTAAWDQNSPYNNLCDVAGGKAAAGCVATAMAIAMRYYQYPPKGSGSVTTYSSGGNTFRGYSLEDHYYNWSNMPLTDDAAKHGSDEQKNQIAQIVHDCGMSVHMSYGLSSSGAYSIDVANALIQNFGYDPSAHYIEKDYYSPSEWDRIMKEELSARRVVIMGAQDTKGSGGHEFIVDGFDANGNLHINWGWGGSSNGYFTIDLTVGSFRFSSGQDATISIKPNQGGTSSSGASLYTTGIQLTGDVLDESGFNVRVDIYNPSYATCKVKVCPVLVDRNGQVKAEISTAEEATFQAMSNYSYSGYGFVFNCKLPSEIALSDRIQIAVTDESGVRSILPYDHTSKNPGFLILQPYNYIEIKSEGYKAGDYLDFILMSNKRADSVTWYFDGVENKAGFVHLTSGKHTVKAVIESSDGLKKETIIQDVIVK